MKCSQCSRTAEDPKYKCCSYCRERGRKKAGKQNPEKRKAWLKTAKGQEYLQRLKSTGSLKESQRKYNRSPKAKARKKRFRDSPKGVASALRDHSKIINKVLVKIRKMLVDSTIESNTVREVSGFASNLDCRAHFENAWEPWMSWDNYGAHSSGNPYDARWQIGHRIARSLYSESIEDVKRCWSHENIFPQCARKNIEARAALPNPNALWQLRHIWPLAWNNVPPDQSLLPSDTECD